MLNYLLCLRVTKYFAVIDIIIIIVYSDNQLHKFLCRYCEYIRDIQY